MRGRRARARLPLTDDQVRDIVRRLITLHGPDNARVDGRTCHGSSVSHVVSALREKGASIPRWANEEIVRLGFRIERGSVLQWMRGGQRHGRECDVVLLPREKKEDPTLRLGLLEPLP